MAAISHLSSVSLMSTAKEKSRVALALFLLLFQYLTGMDSLVDRRYFLPRNETRISIEEVSRTGCAIRKVIMG